MKTVKVIHYPEGGHKTTEIFEGDSVKVIEGYLHELPSRKDVPKDRTFGAEMDLNEHKYYWVILIGIDNITYFAGLNSKVYIMVDGKTVASYESIIVD
jgi:hypothetical protein